MEAQLIHIAGRHAHREEIDLVLSLAILPAGIELNDAMGNRTAAEKQRADGAALEVRANLDRLIKLLDQHWLLRPVKAWGGPAPPIIHTYV